MHPPCLSQPRGQFRENPKVSKPPRREHARQTQAQGDGGAGKGALCALKEHARVCVILPFRLRYFARIRLTMHRHKTNVAYERVILSSFRSSELSQPI